MSRFVVLYTADLVRKRKRWNDGFLTVDPQTKQASLVTDEKNPVDTGRINPGEWPLTEGAELKWGSYLIQVESSLNSTTSSSTSTSTTNANPPAPVIRKKFNRPVAKVSGRKTLHGPRKPVLQVISTRNSETESMDFGGGSSNQEVSSNNGRSSTVSNLHQVTPVSSSASGGIISRSQDEILSLLCQATPAPDPPPTPVTQAIHSSTLSNPAFSAFRPAPRARTSLHSKATRSTPGESSLPRSSFASRGASTNATNSTNPRNSDSRRSLPLNQYQQASSSSSSSSSSRAALRPSSSRPLNMASNLASSSSSSSARKSFGSGTVIVAPGVRNGWEAARKLTWLGEAEAMKRAGQKSGPTPVSRVQIPDRFPSLSVYKDAFVAALYDELRYELDEACVKYYQAMAALAQKSVKQATGGVNKDALPSCRHGPAQVLTASASGAHAGRPYFRCPIWGQSSNSGRRGRPAAVGNTPQACKLFKWVDQAGPAALSALPPEVFLASQGVAYFPGVTLHRTYGPGGGRSRDGGDGDDGDDGRGKRRWRGGGGKWRGGGGWRGGNKYGGGGGGDGGPLNKPNAMFLDLQSTPRNVPLNSSGFSKEDLWIVGERPELSTESGGRIFIARSAFYSPSKDGLLELVPLPGEEMPRWLKGKQTVYALRGPNAWGSLSLMETVKSLAPTSCPLTPVLLNNPEHGSGRGRVFDVGLTAGRVDALVAQVVEKYHLNEDHIKVMEGAAAWFKPDHPSASTPVMLVHGVFGAGKTSLACALILFLVMALGEAPNQGPASRVRILVSAATNTAVDQILGGLVERGYTDFIRVGSLKRISKPILPYSVRGEGKKDTEGDVAELQEMLASSTSDSDKKFIRRALAEHKAGRAGARKSSVSTARVVGTTCHASNFPVLNGNEFPIILQDECSQMVEPLSLMPLTRFKGSKLVGFGDPHQLPPTLAGWSPESSASPNAKADGSTESTGVDGTLARTLFVRLTSMFPPIVLRTQYRCHPVISQIASTLFYGGMLKDGVSEVERTPVLARMPPLMFVDTARSGSESTDRSGSIQNKFEARVMAKLALELLIVGQVPASELGVISLYKAQIGPLNDALTQLAKQVISAGAKAGQDVSWVLGVLPDVKMSTVDAFQGGEKEVILLSTVRTGKLGFIESPHRLNVAMTRARRHLMVVGSADALYENKMWGQIVDRARSVGGMRVDAHGVLSFDAVLVQTFGGPTGAIAKGSGGKSPPDAVTIKSESQTEESSENPSTAGAGTSEESQAKPTRSVVKREGESADSDDEVLIKALSGGEASSKKGGDGNGDDDDDEDFQTEIERIQAEYRTKQAAAAARRAVRSPAKSVAGKKRRSSAASVGGRGEKRRRTSGLNEDVGDDCNSSDDDRGLEDDDESDGSMAEFVVDDDEDDGVVVMSCSSDEGNWD